MPLVSIIVPCLNEEKTIQLLLDAIHRQTYPLSDLEVVILDAHSKDGTRAQINVWRSEHPDLVVTIVDNDSRTIPSAVNRAVETAHGEYIVRLDAHSMPEQSYVERCITLLQNGIGDNVGGVWMIEPGGEGWIARSIAAAAAHPLGVGDALYRYTTQAGEVDTVPFGSFRKDTFEKVGRFNERLLANEDYEFNARLRQMGGRVWLDPAIRSTYFARASLGTLSKQYFRYGFWKWRMLTKFPSTLRWRQALPPVFVFSLAVFSLVSMIIPSISLLVGLEIGLYLLFLIIGGVSSAIRRKDVSMLVGVPLAIATMQICWGSGFVWSMLKSMLGKEPA
jgi:succinoglycan biosynthesis protein ExoA